MVGNDELRVDWRQGREAEVSTMVYSWSHFGRDDSARKAGSWEEFDVVAEHDCDVIALIKRGERFIFLYNESTVDEVLRAIIRCALDRELSFSWYDAGVLSNKIRQAEKTRRK